MAIMSGEVVPTPGEAHPFKVVVSYNGETAEMPVASEAEGEKFIVDMLREMQARAKQEGYR